MGDLAELGLLGLFIGCFLAATVVPFSSDAIFVAAIAVTEHPVECLVAASLGNWLGGVTSYWIGRLCRWEWIEKVFKVKPAEVFALEFTDGKKIEMTFNTRSMSILAEQINNNKISLTGPEFFSAIISSSFIISSKVEPVVQISSINKIDLVPLEVVLRWK